MDAGFSRVIFASLNLIGNIAFLRKSSRQIINDLVHEPVAHIVIVLAPEGHFQVQQFVNQRLFKVERHNALTVVGRVDDLDTGGLNLF